MTTPSSIGTALTVVRAAASLIAPKQDLSARPLPTLVRTSVLVERVLGTVRSSEDEALLASLRETGSPIALVWELPEGLIGYVPTPKGDPAGGAPTSAMVLTDQPGAFGRSAGVQSMFRPVITQEQIIGLRQGSVSSGVDPDEDGDDNDDDRDEDGGGGDSDGDKIPADRDGGTTAGANEEEIRRRIGSPRPTPKPLSEGDSTELGRIFGKLLAPVDPRVTDPAPSRLRSLSRDLERALEGRVLLDMTLDTLQPGPLPAAL
ncbi:MAG: hypothetical protein K0V04_10825 [Deltaproteobacteria bacterium]|nr:hypothetical protein [Deltaproteobacteria bacterium]